MMNARQIALRITRPVGFTVPGKELRRSGFLSVMWCCGWVMLFMGAADAQQAGTQAGTPVAAQAGTENPAVLKQRQEQLGDRFSRFETLLLRLADVEASENPERAALLRRASRQARELFILERINGASGALDEGRFAQALKDQKSAQDALGVLLQLLQSEDRQERIRQEKERIRQLVNDLKRLERAQRSTRGQTESNADLKQASEQQSEIEKRAEELANRLKAEQGEPKPETEPKPNEEPNQEPTPSEGQQKPPEGDESKEGSEKPSDQNQKPGEDSQQPNGQPQDSQAKPSEQNPSQSNGNQPPNDQPPQPQTPQQQAADQLQKAQEAMRQAQQALNEAKRSDASEAQREAEQKLQEAAERLERILRQLREEEVKRQLTRLESRLREIVAKQTEVLEKTKGLMAVPEEQRDRQTDVQSSNLAFEEKKIAADTDRALMLLQEDGSGRAFPEVLTEVRDDMLRVSSRLSQTQLDAVTQGLQEDILAALDEMIKALQQEQQKREQQQQAKQPPQQGQGGQQQEDPLVDAIAELKLIKTQEIRIKNSTERFAKIAQASEPDADLQQLLTELAQRQVRLYRVVRDIVTEQQR